MQERDRRRVLAVVVVVGLFVLLSLNRVATLLTDLWWFSSVGYREVFTGIILTRIGLAIAFGLVLAGLVAGNLWLARRLRPLFIPSTPQQAIVERYRQMLDPYLPWVIAAVALVFGATSGLAVSSQWESFLLWSNVQPFGVADPQFQADVGFYIFELPFLKFVQSWLFTSLVLTTLLTAGAHYLLGGIRPESPGEKVLGNVKTHLSVLLAAILAVRGWGYWLDRYLLNFSPRGVVTGASYTDVNAELPALLLLLGITVVAVALVLYSVRQRGFLLAGAAVGLLVLASILLQGAYPAAIQRLRVEPQELAREEPFIERNLEATRAAYGLDEVDSDQFPIANDLDEAEIQEEQVTLQNIRLWDPATLETTYSELQALRPYYQFIDVDVDRYDIDGTTRQVMLSPRELDISQLEAAQTWQNTRLTFTHGFGVVASQVNVADDEGQPVFLSRDIPTRGRDALVPEDEEGFYYGEYFATSGSPQYSIVSTAAQELDYEDPETLEQVDTDFAGESGVPVGSIVRRAAFALRFADTNLILSNLFRPDSQMLLYRDVVSRVQAVAPFLDLDSDPYVAVVDGRPKWILDGYTSSPFYPYSERRELSTATSRQAVNYVRNSVKATVDAYSGEVTLYVIDDEDPIIAAWQQAFPDAFEPVGAASDELTSHFRFPADLFGLQSELYQRYHIPTARGFYNAADAWARPVDAAAQANRGEEDLSTGERLEPYYLLMRLPGEQEEEFVLIQPYLALDRPNMVAWLAGRSDPGHHGDLFAVRFPSDQTVLGPEQAQTRVEQDDDIAEYITLRSQAGSRVIRGNQLIIPVGESILYVEPLFLQGGEAEIPELARVTVVMGGRVEFARTLEGALAQLVGAQPPGESDALEGDGVDPGADGEPAPPGEQPDVDLEEVLDLLARADEALRDGDLGRYQDLVEQARELLEESTGQGPGPSPSPSPAASPAG